MTENERPDTLIITLIHEVPQYKNLTIPEDLTEKRSLLRHPESSIKTVVFNVFAPSLFTEDRTKVIDTLRK